MKYQFVKAKTNYEDYAAGRVIYTQAGMTSFPVRLASEIFLRCAAVLDKSHLRIYDPCCGSGYLLTVIGYLHGSQISALWGSDISSDAGYLAQKNLNLLTHEGLAQRQSQIEKMLQDYGKVSHAAALNSVEALHQQLPQSEINRGAWTANAMHTTLKSASVDVLITDVPYGNVAAWDNVKSDDPLFTLLEAQFPVLARPSVVAIISDKKQKAAHPKYQRILHDTLGKRRITLLQPM